MILIFYMHVYFGNSQVLVTKIFNLKYLQNKWAALIDKNLPLNNLVYKIC